MFLWPVPLPGLLALLVVWTGSRRRRGRIDSADRSDRALEELRKRYARSDLLDEEFEQRRQNLRSLTDVPSPDVTIDSKDASCPGPLMDLIEKVKNLDAGIVVELQTIERNATTAGPKWLEEAVHDVSRDVIGPASLRSRASSKEDL